MKALVFIAIVMLLISACEIYPRNTLKDCKLQCDDSKKSIACYEFCNCIHNLGHTLDSCLAEYDKSPQDSIRTSKITTISCSNPTTLKTNLAEAGRQ